MTTTIAPRPDRPNGRCSAASRLRSSRMSHDAGPVFPGRGSSSPGAVADRAAPGREGGFAPARSEPSLWVAPPWGVGPATPVHHDGGAQCCLRALPPSGQHRGRKATDVAVAALSAATAHLIVIRPLLSLVARVCLHVRMEPESAYHRLSGHEERCVGRLPVSRVEGPSLATRQGLRRHSWTRRMGFPSAGCSETPATVAARMIRRTAPGRPKLHPPRRTCGTTGSTHTSRPGAEAQEHVVGH